MADPVEIKFTGLQQLEMRLRNLPEKVAKKHLRKAMADGAEVVRLEAVVHASKIIRKRPIKDDFMLFMRGPDLPRHLKDHIVKLVSIRKAGAFARIGLDYSKVHHGHLIEFGTKPHWITFKSRWGKKIRLHHPGSGPQPFMSKAFINKGDEAVELVITRLMAAVELEA
jgi:HK97 gp10 family phage protein